jgi:hypothetical protein
LIHYIGSPITPNDVAVIIWKGNHALLSWPTGGQIPIAAAVCRTFVLDNGAFSFWRSGRETDWDAYYLWVEEWKGHPSFEWALIPDVIDGTEKQNDALVREWPFQHVGVPVWHFHESLKRLRRLCEEYPRVALGSSGEFSMPASKKWWGRMFEVMGTVCDNGRPITKLHGLRMQHPSINKLVPLASDDSISIAKNIGIDKHWNGSYAPPSKAVRAQVLMGRLSEREIATVWSRERAEKLLSLRQ